MHRFPCDGFETRSLFSGISGMLPFSSEKTGSGHCSGLSQSECSNWKTGSNRLADATRDVCDSVNEPRSSLIHDEMFLQSFVRDWMRRGRAIRSAVTDLLQS